MSAALNGETSRGSTLKGIRRSVTWDAGSETATFTYDAAGNLSAMKNDDSSVELTHDQAGQLTAITQLHTGMAGPVVLTYSAGSDGHKA